MEFVLECLGDFTSLCEEKEERFGSMDDIFMETKKGRNEK